MRDISWEVRRTFLGVFLALLTCMPSLRSLTSREFPFIVNVPSADSFRKYAWVFSLSSSTVDSIPMECEVSPSWT